MLHTLEGSKLAVNCMPDTDLERTTETLELDHVLAAVFGFWDHILPASRLFKRNVQLALPMKGPKKAQPGLDESPGRIAKKETG